jgi:hypothetical protein
LGFGSDGDFIFQSLFGVLGRFFLGIWLQTLLLSLPLYLAAFYFRQYVFNTESYRDGSAAVMGAGAMYFLVMFYPAR